jgi:hypothetical protein
MRFRRQQDYAAPAPRRWTYSIGTGMSQCYFLCLM